MANKSPQRSTRTNSKPINAKAAADKPPRKPKGVVKNEGKAPRPSHVVNLINDTLWLLALAAAIFVALSLASFTMTDPAWSRSVAASDEAVRNLGGLFGAYLADVGYYLFGLSVWWWVIAACVFLYKNFRPLHNDEQKPYNTTIAAIGLLVLLICSPILEVFAFKTQLAEALPVGAGGMIGSFAAQGMSWLLGTSGSLLIILVIMLLALSLLVQASWLDILEKPVEKLNGCG